MYEFWTELKIQPKKIPKNLRKFFEKNFFFCFFLVKIPKWQGNSRIWGLKQLRNSGDHEFWNHEMWGSPVVAPLGFSDLPTALHEFLMWLTRCNNLGIPVYCETWILICFRKQVQNQVCFSLEFWNRPNK